MHRLVELPEGGHVETAKKAKFEIKHTMEAYVPPEIIAMILIHFTQATEYSRSF